MIRPGPIAVNAALAGFAFAVLPIVTGGSLWTLWPIYLVWLVVTFGVDVLLAPRGDRVSCSVEAPRSLSIGLEEVATVKVSLGTRFELPVELAFDFSTELEPQPRTRARARRETLAVPVRLVPRRRGTARIDTVWLRYRGPFGFASITRRFEIGHEIQVVPNLVPVRSVALRFFSDRDFRAGVKIERFKGEGTEFDSLKEFVPGDDHRSISWKASARHRKLLSRQYRAERDHHVVLAVDTGRLMAETLDGIPKLDHALNAALLLSYICLRSGDRVGLLTFGASVGMYLQPQGGMGTQLTLTRMAARVAYSESETNFTLGLTTLAQKLRRRALVIVLTDFVDTVTAELMVENLNRLSRRHLVLFVALQDPVVRAVADGPPLGPLELTRAVVAQEMVRDREVVMRRLRRGGVGCIDSPPSRVGSSLVNSYLDIKRREMI
jgi:uncharacterized protein (DUF58 family)